MTEGTRPRDSGSASSPGPDLDRHRGLTRRGSARKSTIVAAAAQLFDTVGYAKTTMDQIAEVNGIGKGTLYHYFSHKAEILFDIHVEVFVPQLISSRARAHEDLPATEMLRLLFVESFAVFNTKPHHVRVLGEHHRDMDDAHRAIVEGHRDEYRELVMGAIAKGAENGELGRHDPELAALSFLGILNWSLVWYRPGGRLSAAEIAEAMWSLAFQGLAPRRVANQRVS